MSYSRSLGYYLFKHPEYKKDIMKELSLNENEYERIVEGRLCLIYTDLIKISHITKESIEYLVNISNNNCYEGMVIPYGKFKSQKSCDKILNLIDSYIDLKEVVEKIEI